MNIRIKLKSWLRENVEKGSLFHNALLSAHRWHWKHSPWLVPWNLDKRKLEIEITTDCNLRCYNCNRAVSKAPSEENISPEQIDKFVRDSIDVGWRWQRIVLSGGEPALHPQLFEIVEILKQYQKINPLCNIGVVTNGYGNKVNSVLSALPDWIFIKNSKKTSNIHEFDSYYMAPVDFAKYKKEDFSRGCFITELCGLGLTRYGFYASGPGASVDRVFGFDIGIKSLSSLNDPILRNQLKLLPRRCYLIAGKRLLKNTKEINRCYHYIESILHHRIG